MKIARQLYDAKELTVEEIARTLGVSRKTIYRHLAEAGSSWRGSMPPTGRVSS